MARYYGNYTGDDSKEYGRIPLDLYRVLITVGTRGQRDYTSLEEDPTLIPNVWFEFTEVYIPRKGYCSLPFNPRNALLWTSQSSYLYVPIPWQANSAQFNEFFTLLKTELSDKYLSVGINGEFIDGSYLSHVVNYG